MRAPYSEGAVACKQAMHREFAQENDRLGSSYSLDHHNTDNGSHTLPHEVLKIGQRYPTVESAWALLEALRTIRHYTRST